MQKSHEAAVVSTCLKQTQWKNCRATGSMVSDDSAVLQGTGPDIIPRNGSATPRAAPDGAGKGIATGLFFQ